MRTLLDRLPIAECLLAVLVAAGVPALVEAAPGAVRQKEVLVLYSTRRDAQIAVIGDREIPKSLEHGLTEGLDYYSEYIDRARFPDPEYHRAFANFLVLKYQGQVFDLVIAVNDLALAFVNEYRQELFATTPIVFFGSPTSQNRPANATGLTSATNLADTIALASELQPDLEHVFVVNGADLVDSGFEKLARAQLKPFESRFQITYLSGLTNRALEERLKALPEHSLVYYLVVDRDGAGENFDPLTYVDRVAAASTAPVYCWVESAMGRGIVGGSLKDQSAEAHMLGELALRVLRGEPADSIPLVSPDLNVRQVDWRQLRRWGISEARVPAGTLVRFREPSAWDRYKAYIIGAAALVLLQSALIAGLLVQKTRRQEAEAAARASAGEVRASYERIRDLGGRLLSAQENERARIARELHDDLSQHMTVLSIDLHLLSQETHVPAAEQLTAQALDQAQTVAKRLRSLSHQLHPANLRLIGLVPSLNGLVREMSTPEVSITFSHDMMPPLADDVTLCLFRVAQEALQNVLKHSGAREVAIRLRCVREAVALSVDDNGVGFDVQAAPRGLGLISMAERVEHVGGTLHVRSNPGGGTHLEVSVPLKSVVSEAEAV
jgi:signal transduction histidine kinase